MNGSEEGWPSQGLFAHDTLRMNEYLQLRYVAETGQLFNYEKTTPGHENDNDHHYYDDVLLLPECQKRCTISKTKEMFHL